MNEEERERVKLHNMTSDIYAVFERAIVEAISVQRAHRRYEESLDAIVKLLGEAGIRKDVQSYIIDQLPYNDLSCMALDIASILGDIATKIVDERQLGD